MCINRYIINYIPSDYVCNILNDFFYNDITGIIVSYLETSSLSGNFFTPHDKCCAFDKLFGNIFEDWVYGTKIEHIYRCDDCEWYREITCKELKLISKNIVINWNQLGSDAEYLPEVCECTGTFVIDELRFFFNMYPTGMIRLELG